MNDLANFTDIEITLVTIGLDRLNFNSLNLLNINADDDTKPPTYNRVDLYNILKEKLNARFVSVSVNKEHTAHSPQIRQLQNKSKKLKPNGMKSAMKLIFQDDDKDEYIGLFGTGCCTIPGGKMIDYSDKKPLVYELCDMLEIPYPDDDCFGANMIRTRTLLKSHLNKNIANEQLFEVLTNIYESQTGEEEISIIEVPYNEEKMSSYVKIKIKAEGRKKCKNKIKGDSVTFYTGGNVTIIVKSMEKCNMIHNWLDNIFTEYFDTILVDKEE